MATTFDYKVILDKPTWRPLAFALNASAAASCIAYDQRNSTDCHPWVYQFVSAAIVNAYNTKTNEHIFLGSPTMGTFAAGAGACFVPSAGPNGTVSSNCTSTSIVISTALASAVGINQLANRGDGTGFKLRVIGNSAGGSGKTEEVTITANTGGTSAASTTFPTLTITPALTFTPAAGDRYEMLSGRVFLMATAASIFKFYDVATNSFSAALTATNLTTPAVDNTMFVLDELYVPTGRTPGQGYFGNMTATGSSATTLTGTAGATDASLAVNEYANFQIRIVTDTATPTAVGQRRKIDSHTAATPTVYTVRQWAVTPSTTCTYVVEAVGDIVCFTGSAVAVSHTYAAGGFRTDGSWSTGAAAASGNIQIPNRQANSAAGMTAVWASSYTSLDTAKNTRYSGVYYLRGGATSTMDVLDIAANSWTTGIGGAAIIYGGATGTTFTTGTCSAYDPITSGGRYMYIHQSGIQRFYRFDCKNRVMEPFTYLPYLQGAAVLGNKLALVPYIDGTTKTGFLLHWRNTGQEWFEVGTGH